MDLNNVVYKDEPFIMAYQARKIFYVNDPCNEMIICLGSKKHM